MANPMEGTGGATGLKGPHTSTPSLPIDLERQLVERARKGDQRATGELYDHYVQPLYRFCLARVQNETDAEDLTEEIFLKIIRNIGTFEWRPLPPPRSTAGRNGATPTSNGASSNGPSRGASNGERASEHSEQDQRSPFRAWLYRIARNHIISHYRATTARPTAGEVPEWIQDQNRGPQELAELTLTIKEVFQAVEQLPQAQREVILLRFGSGLTVQETAEALDKQQTNIKVLQHKGIKKLKDLFTGQQPTQQAQPTARTITNETP